MAKIIKMYPKLTSTLVSENEFTKVFKIDEVDMYVSQAFDEESSLHYLICSIPEIPIINVSHIQFPISFNTKQEMQQAFKEQVTPDWASKFLMDAIQHIEDNRQKAELDALNKKVADLVEIGCIESNITDIIFYKDVSICTKSELSQLSKEDWQNKINDIKTRIQKIDNQP